MAASSTAPRKTRLAPWATPTGKGPVAVEPGAAGAIGAAGPGPARRGRQQTPTTFSLTVLAAPVSTSFSGTDSLQRSQKYTFTAGSMRAPTGHRGGRLSPGRHVTTRPDPHCNAAVRR